MRLDDIAEQYGTDKGPSYHHYTTLYERYFVPTLPAMGHPDLALLELGWGGHEDPDAGGASARMWRDWLPGWRIIVVDNEQKHYDEKRDRGIALLHMDQTDPDITAFGPFDIIIDDASHLSSLTIASFELLWPHLKPGGWYVVEDTHMAYHSHYYGEEEADPSPDTSRRTAMQFLKRLADEANFKGRDEWDLFPPMFSLGYDVEEIHFHFNICFVRKRA
jgi:hypothetical protein